MFWKESCGILKKEQCSLSVKSCWMACPFFLHHLFGKILPYLFLFVTTTFGMFWVCCELWLYFSGAPGHFPDPAKCRLLSVNEKRELVRELSKFPGNAPEQLQEWTRREIVEILCVELGRERKYTGLSKQRMLDHLFRVVNGKSSDHRKHLESNPESNASNLQSPSKRHRKDDSNLQFTTSSYWKHSSNSWCKCTDKQCTPLPKFSL